jgi:hypothetical protein
MVVGNQKKWAGKGRFIVQYARGCRDGSDDEVKYV